MADRNAAIRLADVGPFRLGELRVQPATRQLFRGDSSEILEPRVMQVLVALAQANGAVISRDELIERCWGGVIVGENAIQRVISRLRQVAATLGKGCFQLETITKVGYRIIAPAGTDLQPARAKTPAIQHEVPQPSEPVQWSRRLVLAGSAATTAIAAVSLYLKLKPQPAQTNNSAAQALYDKGIAIRESGGPDEQEQAIAYFRQATRLAPNMAEAWGGLAYGYANAAYFATPQDWPNVAARCRSAAQRALQLDPRDADARTALVFLGPLYRNWGRVETNIGEVLRAVPNHRRANGLMAQMLSEVGRWRNAIPHYLRITGPNDFIAPARFGLIHALWNAGRLDEAEDALNVATARWPKHGSLWETRVKFLAFTGRPQQALALIEDKSGRPSDDSVWPEGLAAIIGASGSTDKHERRRVIEMVQERIRKDPGDARSAMEYMPTLGAVGEAFELANGIYLGQGPWAKAAVRTNRFEGWVTAPLFGVLTAPMRADPRFGPLMQAIGLEDYWRRSHSQPDYRAFPA
jgi:DNA-binding winged helix-turn-helix (wHTH) protein